MSVFEAAPQHGAVSSPFGSSVKTIISVAIADGTRKKIATMTDVLVRDLIPILNEKFEVPNNNFMFLCDRISDPSGSIVDKWLDPNKTLNDQDVGKSSELFYLYKLVKLPADTSNERLLELLFFQVLQCVVSGKYSCSERLAVRLAALQIQISLGDYDPLVHRPGYLSRIDVATFLPFTVTAHSSEYWQKRLFRQHQVLKGMNKHAARKLYIQLARSYIPNFGLSFFSVVDDSAMRVLVGIGEDGVFFYDPHEFSVLQSLQYNTISKIAETSTGFTMQNQVVKLDVFSGIISGSSSDSASVSDAMSVESLNLNDSQAPREVWFADEQTQAVIAEGERNHVFECSKLVSGAIVDLAQAYMDSLSSDLYIEPIARFPTIPGEFESRLEFFKYIYCELCTLNGVAFSELFCERLDNTIDDDAILEALDLSGCSVGSQMLNIIGEATVQAANYKSTHGMFDENVNIVVLDLSANYLDEFAVQGLMTLIDALPDVVSLNLSHNLLDNRVCMSLAEILGKCQCIGVLNLGHNDLGNKGTKAILQAVQSASLLTTLDVSANRLSDQGADAIAQFIKDRPSLTDLNVSKNEITSSGMQTLCLAISASKSIRLLNLSTNPFNAASVSGLASMFRSGSLIDVSLCQCKMTATVAAAISQTMIASSSRITTLDLSDNVVGAKYTNEEAHQIGELISSDIYDRLVEIRLDRNGIDSAFSHILAEHLPSNIHLQVASLSGNPLATKDSAFGLDALFAANLFKMKGMLRLDLSNTGLRGEGLQNLFSVLKASKNTSLVELSVEGCDLSKGEGLWQYLADPHSHVRHLNISKCKVSDSILLEIAGGLRMNARVQRLDMRGNQITTGGIEQAMDLLRSNRQLSILDLRENPTEKNATAVRDMVLHSLPNAKVVLV
eukprot:ANDGO_03783.mRNA.1 FERM domain-containing protein C